MSRLTTPSSSKTFLQRSIAVLAVVFTSTVPGPIAADSPRFEIENEAVVVGATEIEQTFGMAPSFDDWWDFTTFYNTTVTKVGNSYYVWAQTGWDGAGCPDTNPQEGLDNVVVFKSASPDSGFYPRGCTSSNCGGSISRSEMRASLVTDTNMLSGTQNNNACDVNWMWGLGDVIPFSGQYLATYDLSKNGLPDGSEYFGDHAKFHLYLSSSDGKDRTSKMYLFAETTSQQVPQRIIVDPVTFAIDADTVGVIFRYTNAAASDGFCCGGTGYMYIDFSTFPSSFTTWVLASDNSYQRLDASNGYGIDFQFKNITASGAINRVLSVDGKWTAFHDAAKNGDAQTCSGTQTKSSKFGYRPFSVQSDGRWGGWLESSQDVNLTGGTLKDRDYDTGLMYPSPLFESNGTLHFYFTQDNQCQGGFAYLDIMHAEMLVTRYFDSFTTTAWNFPGTPIEVGGVNWLGNNNLRTTSGHATGKNVDPMMIAAIPIVLGSAKTVTLQADMTQIDSGIQHLGLSSAVEAYHQATGESVWFQYQKNGQWYIRNRKNSATSTLASGGAPTGWVNGSTHTWKFVYHADTSRVDLYYDGNPLATSVNLTFTPNVGLAGFQGRATRTEPEQLNYQTVDGHVDNFSVDLDF